MFAANMAFSAIQSNLDGGGKNAASFLSISPSVRHAALGGDQVAAHGEVSDLFSNPAALHSLAIPSLWLSHNNSFLNTKYNTLGFGLPLENQVLAFTGQYISEGEEERVQIDSNNNLNTDLGKFQYSTLLVTLSYAKQLNDHVALGATLKGWNEGRDQTSQSSWASDVGLQFPSLLTSLDLGASIRNLGPASEGFDLPQSYVVGAAYHFTPNKKLLNQLTLYSELDFTANRDAASRLGVEFKQNHMWLRAGYQNLTNDLEESLSSLSLGAGLRIKSWKLDYAWSPRGELGDQHRISLNLGFGLTPEEKAAESKRLDQIMAQRMQGYAQTHLNEGEAAIAKGKWSLAVQKLNQVLVWDPNNIDATQKLVLAQRNLKFRKANQFYRDGLKLAKHKQWLEAALKWEQTLKLVPTHKQAKKYLSRAKYKITSNAKLNTYGQKGISAYLNEDYDKAIAIWNKGLKSNPEDNKLRAYITKAEVKQLKLKLKMVNQENGTHGKGNDALNQQAYTFYMLGKTKKAIGFWEKILEQDPNSKDIKNSLKEARAKLALQNNKINNVSGKKVKELNTNAMKAYGKGNLEQAAILWRRALILDPRNSHIKNNLRRTEMELTSVRMERRN